jgi:cell wall-associated NlpC family hydrolase
MTAGAVIVSAGLSISDSGGFLAFSSAVASTNPEGVPRVGTYPSGAPDLGGVPALAQLDDPVREKVKETPAPVSKAAPTASVRRAPAAPKAPEKSIPAAPAPSQAASGVAAIAEDFIGIPYRYGGKTSAGLDCSGLVYKVLQRAGLSNTYRTSGALRAWATPISKSQARPGDLVFGPGHVGIYMGGGMMIDAPQPGTRVGLHRVYSSMTSYGRIPT